MVKPDKSQAWRSVSDRSLRQLTGASQVDVPMRTAPHYFLTSVVVPMLERRYAPLIVTVCAYAMRRLAVCHVWLQDVSKRAASEVSSYVALLLAHPLFLLHGLLFELVYFLKQRELLFLRRECAVLRGEDLFPHVHQHGGMLGVQPERHELLYTFIGRLERTYRSTKRGRFWH